MQRTLVTACWLSLALASLAPAQTASTPVSVASFANPNFVNGKIAQGMMFEVFGDDIAAAGLNLPAGFPLQTELLGTSVQVTIGGQVRDCFVVRTLANDRVAAILPSDTPVGTGTLIVTYNGRSTPPVSIEVVAHSPGVFTLASTGAGPGVFTDPLTNQINTVFNAFQPGDLVDVWMTGLGAAPFADNVLPPLADLGYDVDITVGGIPAQASFHGRSAGCCAGVDIARFMIPAGVAGCHVPVIISVNGVPGNVTTMSIGADRGLCTDDEIGLNDEVLAAARQNGGANLGTIALSRATLTVSGLPGPIPGAPAQAFRIDQDNVAAGFHRFTPDDLLRYMGPVNASTTGACIVRQFSGEQFDDSDPIRDAAQGLRAGDMLLSGPGGTRTVSRLEPGLYFESLSTMAPGLPGGLPGFPSMALDSKNQFTSMGFLEPGQYVASLSGGEDVGPITASIDISEKPTTNLDSIDVVPRDRPLHITYSRTGSAEWVWIAGFSVINSRSDPQGAIFICRASIDAGAFDVPTAVLQLLPPSEVISVIEEEGTGRRQSIPTGNLMVGHGSLNPFTASGLDQGSIIHTDTDMKLMEYR